MASKIVKARAHAAQVRVGKQAIADTLKTEARGAKKLEKAMTTAAANPAKASPFCYAVMVDAQGVAYLRVEETEKGSRFIVATGAAIEVVEMDAATIRSRALKVVPEASVLEATEILARPLTKSVIISKRANEYLNTILNNKEFTTMATATKKAAKKAATKTSAAAKTGPSKAKTTGASRTRSLDNDIVVAKIKENPLREGTFCHAQVAALIASNGKTVADAQKKLDASGQNASKRRIEIAWATKKGYITVKSA